MSQTKIDSTPMFCRLSVPTTLDELYQYLDKKYSTFIISQEEATNTHFHCLIYTSDSCPKNANQNLKNYLKKCYPQLTGNADYAITKVQKGTDSTLKKYVVKEGLYLHKGFTPEEIQVFHKQSSKKFEKKKFQKEFVSLIDAYMARPIDGSEMGEKQDVMLLIDEYIQLKIDYHQPIHRGNILNQVNTFYGKKYGSKKLTNSIYKSFVDQFWGVLQN